MIKFDFNNMMDAYIGSEGITEKDGGRVFLF